MLLKLLGFRFVFGSCSSFFHCWFCPLLFYSFVASFQQFHTNPPQLNQHRQVYKNLHCKVLWLSGFSRVQTCLRFNIAIVIHLKQFRLGMFHEQFVWSFMKAGVHHSDRPTFSANINTEKRSFDGKQRFFDGKKKLFQISRRNADFTNTHVVDCCGWFCVSFQIMWFAIFAVVVQLFESSWICYQREQLHVEAFVCFSLWFKVCTCPKLIEWQIRFFPSKSIVKGGPLSFSLSEEALKFDRILT